ncbi:hypothetical protein NliqN6_5209 [Naganishia liquefaciens]|uniref:Uncharacterized protein n=1 Tax=Naganishia liquefaciens TaxID=104408 RepID=A0A8H3TX84_9TREE|nr:hypothetical protein NliqN6_5209 [Naganishia liquefaciens]
MLTAAPESADRSPEQMSKGVPNADNLLHPKRTQFAMGRDSPRNSGKYSETSKTSTRRTTPSCEATYNQGASLQSRTGADLEQEGKSGN